MGRLVVVARGLYLARHLFTLSHIPSPVPCSPFVLRDGNPHMWGHHEPALLLPVPYLRANITLIDNLRGCFCTTSKSPIPAQEGSDGFSPAVRTCKGRAQTWQHQTTLYLQWRVSAVSEDLLSKFSLNDSFNDQNFLPGPSWTNWFPGPRCKLKWVELRGSFIEPFLIFWQESIKVCLLIFLWAQTTNDHQFPTHRETQTWTPCLLPPWTAYRSNNGPRHAQTPPMEADLWFPITFLHVAYLTRLFPTSWTELSHSPPLLYASKRNFPPRMAEVGSNISCSSGWDLVPLMCTSVQVNNLEVGCKRVN